MRDGNEMTVSNNDFSFFQNKCYIKDGCVNFFMYARLRQVYILSKDYCYLFTKCQDISVAFLHFLM